MTLESWLEADANQELCDIAGGIAYDALRGYHDARDLAPPVDMIRCRQIAADIAFAGRRGWEYAAADSNDPAGEIAKKLLAQVGFQIRSGNIGFDATIQPIAA